MSLEIKTRGGTKGDVFGLKKTYKNLKDPKIERAFLNDIGFFLRDKILRNTKRAIDSEGNRMELNPEYADVKADKGAPAIANMRGVGKGVRMLSTLTHKVSNHAVRVYFSVARKGLQAFGLIARGFNFMSLNGFILRGIEKIEAEYLKKILK